MPSATNWHVAIQPLLKKYRNKRHPLEYGNVYELLVMVVLSAQDSDKNINNVAPALFQAFPTMKALSKATEVTLLPLISKVRGSRKKTDWLIDIAGNIKIDKNIPLTHEGLTALKGIGSKSANVILRESGKPAEGIIVDLHVVRVAPRLGIAKGTDPKKNRTAINSNTPKKRLGCRDGHVIPGTRNLPTQTLMRRMPDEKGLLVLPDSHKEKRNKHTKMIGVNPGFLIATVKNQDFLT